MRMGKSARGCILRCARCCHWLDTVGSSGAESVPWSSPWIRSSQSSSSLSHEKKRLMRRCACVAVGGRRARVQQGQGTHGTKSEPFHAYKKCMGPQTMLLITPWQITALYVGYKVEVSYWTCCCTVCAERHGRLYFRVLWFKRCECNIHLGI